MRRPSRPPTAAEYAVIVALFAIVPLLVGGVGLGFWMFDPPADPATAAKLLRLSMGCLGIASVVGFGIALFRHLTR